MPAHPALKGSSSRVPPPVEEPPVPESTKVSKALHRCHTWWVLDPRREPFVARWDLGMSFALVYVALVTPVEVGLRWDSPGEAEKWVDVLFLMNRVLDCCFITDMVLQFRLAFKAEGVDGTHWVTSASAIAYHYLTSFWFSLDFFSVLTSIFDLVEMPTGGSSLVALKAVRTLRLLKLVKLARGSRVFKRWEMKISINYKALSLCSILVIIVLTCHWTACLWGLAASFSPLHGWAGTTEYCVAYRPDENGVYEKCPANHYCKPLFPPGCNISLDECDSLNSGFDCEDGFTLYIYALYFAIMTITSVGFGDVAATPFNVPEQIVCSVIMFITALLWGYLVGVFCTVSAPSPSVQAFRDELSQLNAFMTAHGLPAELRFRLREFLHETVHLRDAEARRDLLTKLSPAMQGEVALMVNRGWVSKVWYLQRDTQLELLIDLASNLKAQVFAPREFCPCGVMYICHKGSALYGGRTRYPGSSWGEDVLIKHRELELSFAAIAITYLWVFTIDAARLHASLAKFPRAQKRLLKVARMWTIRRAVVRHAERLCYERKTEFRGRAYPIYAKEIALKIREEKAKEYSENRSSARMGKSRAAFKSWSQSHSSFCTTFADGGSSSSQTVTSAERRRLQRRIFSLSPAVIGSIFVKRLSNTVRRGSSRRLQVDAAPASPSFLGQIQQSQRSGPGSPGAPASRRNQRRGSLTGGEKTAQQEDQDEKNMHAAINFGLQLREEQMAEYKLGDGGGESSKVLIDEVQQMRVNERRLYDEVSQMKSDMRDMLSVLRQQHQQPREDPVRELDPESLDAGPESSRDP
eukprot:Transcript_28161.p1 GENE.Transcript_28161~~Transcript_28161.p1  ORF type:complete len:808 (-),score=261.71 Transcript_28161:1095-3518(-)